jgi:hypothetical protein
MTFCMAKKLFLPLLSVAAVLITFVLLHFSALADTVSQSYVASNTIPSGSIVSLQSGSSTQIELTTPNNLNSLLGIAVSAQSSLVNLNSVGGNTEVVSSGNAVVLVSDINGSINQGDSLTASPIAGVAMKATAPGKIIGTANVGFSAAQATDHQQVTDKDGKTTTVNIGSIAANVALGNYQNQPTLNGNGIISAVQAVATSTTGKNISAARALLALMVLLVAVVISILILYTSVAGSIRSIGRNPLSRHTILQSLIQVIIAVVVIMMCGFSIVYLIIGR